MLSRQNVTKAKCYQGKMLPRQNVTRQNVTRQNVTRQSVTRQNVTEPCCLVLTAQILIISSPSFDVYRAYSGVKESQKMYKITIVCV